MIEFLIWALCLLVVLYVVKLIVDELPLTANIKRIVCLIVGLIFLFILLDKLGVYHFALTK